VTQRALSPTDRTTLRRYPERGRTDRTELFRVLDAGFLCFMGTIVDDAPRVTPMTYARIDDVLYLHGSPVNQGLLAGGGGMCITVAHVDALVLAASLYHHSANFRSATIYGCPRIVSAEDERRAAFHALGNNLVPGRADALPPPTKKQIAGTLLLAASLEEASVKVRTGPPGGEDEDYEGDTWAGVLPLIQTWGEPEPDPRLRRPLPVPEHVARVVGTPAFVR
jgi:nitroimidazol reductase NimA-like FMN-containing flavoprotein (pyridoxamine 5'-phosphate oxidase superfamily)